MTHSSGRKRADQKTQHKYKSGGAITSRRSLTYRRLLTVLEDGDEKLTRDPRKSLALGTNSVAAAELHAGDPWRRFGSKLLGTVTGDGLV